MIAEDLHTYRLHRTRFIDSLKKNYGIDYYKLRPQERKEWFGNFLRMKRALTKKLERKKSQENYVRNKKNVDPSTFRISLGPRAK